jgi:hypothetical protein
MKQVILKSARDRKNWLSLLTLSAMAVLAVGSVDSEEKTRQVKSALAEASVSAQQLYNQYEANEVEADNRYKGKVISVTGVIGDIGKDITDNAYVLLSSGDLFGMFGVQCFFDESEEQNFGSLRTGQQLTIKGRCDGKFGNVFLKDCTFQ